MASELVPTAGFADFRYGPDAHHRMDVYKHPTADVGGNPWLVFRHGGAWNTNDKRLISLGVESSGGQQRGNAVANYLLNQKTGAGDRHFTIISIETRQQAFATPNSGNTHNATVVRQDGGTGWYDEPTTYPCYFPDAWVDYKRAICAIKANAVALGIDPAQGIASGSSSGGMMAVWSQVTEPFVLDRPLSDNRSVLYGYDNGGVDSRVRGVWAHITPIDFRFQPGTTTETVTASVWKACFGTPTATEQAALPNATRAAVSIKAYIEQAGKGGLKWMPPGFFTYETASSAKPYTLGHELEQFGELMAAQAKAGVSLFGGRVGVGWADSNLEESQRSSAALYSFLDRALRTPQSAPAFLRPVMVG